MRHCKSSPLNSLCSASFQQSICMAEPATASTVSMIAFVASWVTPSSLFLFLNLVVGSILLSYRFTPKKPTQKSELGPHDSSQLVRSSSLLERVRSFNFGFQKYEPTNVETEYIQPVRDRPQLVRTPSLLERVTLFNFGFHKYDAVAAETEHIQPDQPECQHPNPNPDNPPEGQERLARTPSLLERLKSINFSALYRSDSVHADEESEIQAQGSDQDHTSGNLVKSSKSATHKQSPAKSSVKKSASEKSNFRNFDGNEAKMEQRRPETVRNSGRESETTSFGEDDGVDAKADDFINRFKQQLRLQRLDSLLRYRETPRPN